MAGMQEIGSGAHAFRPGDIVRNFKRETVTNGSTRYLYRVVARAQHTETEEPLVVYEALYPPFGIWARPEEMFLGKVDRVKYPDILAYWRFDHATSGDLEALGR